MRQPECRTPEWMRPGWLSACLSSSLSGAGSSGAIVTEPVFQNTDDDSTVLVVHQDGRVQPSPVPAGFDPTVFRDILAAINVYYLRNGVMPTVYEVAKSWTRIPKKTYSKAYAAPELKAALELRGLSLGPETGISPEQARAIQLLSDPTDRRTLNVKLRQLGISMPKYQNWMRQPLFAELLSKRSEQNLGDAVHVAMNRLIGNADAGDQRAIEKVLEISGRYNPQQQELVNARQVVLVLVEAVLKHVPDKEAKDAILAEVESAMRKGSIMNELTRGGMD